MKAFPACSINCQEPAAREVIDPQCCLHRHDMSLKLLSNNAVFAYRIVLVMAIDDHTDSELVKVLGNTFYI